jgi:elongator complex protein 1
MSLHQLTLNRKAVDVAISMSGNRFAVLSEGDVALYLLDLKKRPVPPPTLVWRCEAFEGFCPRHVTFLGNDQVCVLADAWDEEESFVWVSEKENLVPKGPILQAEKVSFITSSVDFQQIYVHFQDGSVHGLLFGDSFTDVTLKTSLAISLPTFVPEAKVVFLDGEVCTVPRNNRHS